MKNLFLIDGATGAGKWNLLHYVTNNNIDTGYVQKFTTRSEYPYEKKNKKKWKNDLEFVKDADEFESKNLEYKYMYGNHKSGFYKYGFSKNDLDTALSKHPNVFVIIRDANLIRRLKKEYSYIKVVSVFIYSNPEHIRNSLDANDFPEQEKDTRINRIDIAYQDYLRHPSLYDEVIINDRSEEDYNWRIDQLLDTYHSEPDIDEKKVFVLMSFSRKNHHLADYFGAIKRAVENSEDGCSKTGFECYSLHDLTGSFGITQVAKKNIHNCRLAIIDLTVKSPNVYYELGYVHGIAKSFIITAHKKEKLPFYPKEYKVVIYKNASELEKKLRTEIKGQLSLNVDN